MVLELVRLTYPIICSGKQMQTSTTYSACSAKVMSWKTLKARIHPLCEQASTKCAGAAGPQMPGPFF